MEEEVILSAKDVAERLQVKPATVRLWFKRGQLPGRKLGKEWYMLESALFDFLRVDQASGAEEAGGKDA